MSKDQHDLPLIVEMMRRLNFIVARTGSCAAAARVIGVSSQCAHRWVNMRYFPSQKNIRKMDKAYFALLPPSRKNMLHPHTQKLKKRKNVDKSTALETPPIVNSCRNVNVDKTTTSDEIPLTSKAEEVLLTSQRQVKDCPESNSGLSETEAQGISRPMDQKTWVAEN